MPRDLPLGNGKLLINFDDTYHLRDIYWPYVGQALHTAGDISRLGVWVSDKFAWLDAPEWQRVMKYEPETLVTDVTLTHPALQLKLVFHDTIDFEHPLLLRHIEVTNLADQQREVRLFFHYDWYIWENADGNTVFYAPHAQALIAYKQQAYFLMNGQIGRGPQAQMGVSSWATGIKKFRGVEGTWRDAEDGELQRNPIAEGSVDSTLALHLPPLASQQSGEVFHWLAVGQNMHAVLELDDQLKKEQAQTFLARIRHYWQSWVNKSRTDFADLPPHLVELYKHSLLILRTQSDRRGAIVAATDASVERFWRDDYSYMWPRDGALVANAFNQASYGGTSRPFYDFCNAVLTPEGYLMHKYHPDYSWGTSWHPWIDQQGQPQLPIQEDETALIPFSLWQHYEIFHDIEYVTPYYHSLIVRSADFLTSYRDPSTHLPLPSYDLWEERRGVLAFTTAAVYAGLVAATKFARLFGEEERAAQYEQAAREIKAATLRYLWDEERGHFLRMITIDANGQMQKDATLDSSLCGLFLFGLFSANDPQIERTMQILERTLWVRTEVGGMARYEHDRYHQVTDNIEQAQGNPWFICTLWLAHYRMARATRLDELHQALPLLEWAHTHARHSGIMAEQINPFTSEPLSVSPLTWSHAEYVLAVCHYLKMYRQLQIGG